VLKRIHKVVSHHIYVIDILVCGTYDNFQGNNHSDMGFVWIFVCIFIFLCGLSVFFVCKCECKCLCCFVWVGSCVCFMWILCLYVFNFFFNIVQLWISTKIYSCSLIFKLVSMCLYICLSSTQKNGMHNIYNFCVYYWILFFYVEGILPNKDQNYYILNCIF
jgi:hypothetical protein